MKYIMIYLDISLTLTVSELVFWAFILKFDDELAIKQVLKFYNLTIS